MTSKIQRACFFCGCGIHEIALEDIKNPETRARAQALPDAEVIKIIADYVPCEDCKALMTASRLVLEISDVPIAAAQPPLVRKDEVAIYPTGNWWLVDEESYCTLLDELGITEKLKEAGRTKLPKFVSVPKELAEAIGLYDENNRKALH